MHCWSKLLKIFSLSLSNVVLDASRRNIFGFRRNARAITICFFCASDNWIPLNLIRCFKLKRKSHSIVKDLALRLPFSYLGLLLIWWVHYEVMGIGIPGRCFDFVVICVQFTQADIFSFVKIRNRNLWGFKYNLADRA